MNDFNDSRAISPFVFSKEKSPDFLQKLVFETYSSIFENISINQILSEILSTLTKMSVKTNPSIVKPLTGDLLALTICLASTIDLKLSQILENSKCDKVSKKKKAAGVIYRLTSPSGKQYIGQTKHFFERMRYYRYSKNARKQPKIINAIRKYGFDEFLIDILEVCYDSEIMNSREEHWIKLLKSTEKGYNIRLGGHCASFSEETIRKMSENNWLKTKGATEEYRRTMSIATSGDRNGFYGKTHTEKTKKVLRQYFSGKKLSPENCARISRGHVGLKQSEATKNKKAKANAKYKYSVTTPNGQTLVVDNLSKFSRDHNISAGALCTVASGRRGHHKGYKVLKLA